MRDKARFSIMVMVCVTVLIICSGCGNRNCGLISFATEQAASTDQALKKAAIEQIDDSLKSIVITTISWNNNTLSFLSEKVEIEERRVILYNVCGQIDADTNWTIPMSADCLTIYLPMGKDCFVHINGKDLLFPKEVE